MPTQRIWVVQRSIFGLVGFWDLIVRRKSTCSFFGLSVGRTTDSKMTALSIVLPPSVVQNIKESNALFPGIHGTQQQLRAVWENLTEDGRTVVVDDNLDTGLQMPAAVALAVPNYHGLQPAAVALHRCASFARRCCQSQPGHLLRPVPRGRSPRARWGLR